MSEKIPESSYKEGHGTLRGTDRLGCGDVQPGNRFSSAALTRAAAGRAQPSARGEQGVLKHFAQVTRVFLWRPLGKSCPGSLLLGWQVWGDCSQYLLRFDWECSGLRLVLSVTLPDREIRGAG